MGKRFAYCIGGIVLVLALLYLAPRLADAASSTAPASLVGRVLLQSRTDFAGVTVSVAGQSLGTYPDGSFMFPSLPVGTYSVTASKPGFVSAFQADVEIVDGQATTMAEIVMPAGDVDGDNDVDLIDLVVLGRSFGSIPPPKAVIDLNDDAQINIFDLVLLASNYGLLGPVTWDAVTLPTPTPSPTPTYTPTPVFSPTPTATPSPTPTPVCIGPEEVNTQIGLDTCVRYHVDKVTKLDNDLYLYALKPASDEILYYTYMRSDLWHCWPAPIDAYMLGKELQVQGKLVTSRAYPHISLTDCSLLHVLGP